MADYIAKHPTPGDSRPASSEGTWNDATPPEFSASPWRSPVRSYSTTFNGLPAVVNVTLPGHPLFPGWVVRYQTDGIMHNFGEGTGFLQDQSSPWRRDMADSLINSTWYKRMAEAIEACKCK